MAAGREDLNAKLAQTLEAEIRSGRYAAGGRLPPHREIARRHKVSIGTVTKAIELLSGLGLVRGEVGRGTFVLGSGHELSSEVIDLSVNVPLRVVDRDVLAEAARVAAQRCWNLPGNGYGDLAGYAEHRQTIATWLSRTRVQTEADELVLTVGAQQALWLAFAAVGPGAIATEPLTFPGAIAAARSLDIPLEAIECDRHGMLPAALEKAARGGRLAAIYLTPTAQNPLAFEMPAARRKELAAVCSRSRVAIIEDDVYGIYARAGIPTFRQLLPQRTYFLGGFSKNLTPLLRVGFLVPPPEHRGAVLTRLRASCWACPPLNTGIVQLLINGKVERTAVSRLRDEASARAVIVRKILQGYPVEVDGLSPHVFLRLEQPIAERAVSQAIERGLRLLPLSATQVGPPTLSGLRLSISAPADRGALTRGLAILRNILRNHSDVAI
jgi:DNA-binding transcriptional MocR family regulator